MNNSALPLGTIVRVKDRKEKFIIVGTKVKKNNKRYDYLCLAYPVGYHDNSEFLFIDDEDVTSMYFLGDINY